MLASGTYSYTVSASGYRNATGSFTIPNDRNITVTLRSSNSGNNSNSGSSSSDRTYSIDVDVTGSRGGSVTLSPTRASAGTRVTITVPSQQRL